MTQLPEAFVEEMSRQLQDELPAFLRAMEAEPCRGLRRNPLKQPETGLPPLEPVPWAADGFYLPLDSRAGAVPLHEAGAWYLQDPGAMLPAAVLGVRPGERVLDLCAAPGGKTTQLGAMLRGEGLLVANEPVAKRAQILSRNVERMGLTNTLVISELPAALAARWPGGFDAVLVDAPCSGEGMFRRHPETRAEWSPAARDGCALRQREILDAAAMLVRPGGRLVYATCTLNGIENEGNVRHFLRQHPDFALAPFSLPGADAPEGMLTCYPHRMRGEGQFAALFLREGNSPAGLPAARQTPPDRNALRLLRDFAPAPECFLWGGTLVSLPGCPDLRGLRVWRCGLHLGTAKERYFQPDHAWAVSAAPPELPRVPLREAEAVRWLNGEQLPCELPVQGWVLPSLQGLPLGFGKAVNGQLKNHMPKGLRRSLHGEWDE